MVNSGRGGGRDELLLRIPFPSKQFISKTLFFMEYQQTQCTHSQQMNVQTNRDNFKGRVGLFDQEMAYI